MFFCNFVCVCKGKRPRKNLDIFANAKTLPKTFREGLNLYLNPIFNYFLTMTALRAVALSL